MEEFDRSLAVVIGINDYQNGVYTLQTNVPDPVAITTQQFKYLAQKISKMLTNN